MATSKSTVAAYLEATGEAKEDSRGLMGENRRLREQLLLMQDRLRGLEANGNIPTAEVHIEQDAIHSLIWTREQQWSHMSRVEPVRHRGDSEELASLNTALTDDSLHDQKLNGPGTFCKQPSEVSGRTLPLKAKQSDVEEGTVTTMTDQSLFEYSVRKMVDEPFFVSLFDRAGWLVGLMMFQSCSSIVLKKHEALLEEFPVIVRFLTMLVGVGGNAGSQACVRVIRGLAVGSLTNDDVKSYLRREALMGICLTLIVGAAGYARVATFDHSSDETLATTASLLCIMIVSICIGSALPLLMHFVRLDPAHSSITIQALMDILGVVIIVHVSGAILD